MRDLGHEQRDPILTGSGRVVPRDQQPAADMRGGEHEPPISWISDDVASAMEVTNDCRIQCLKAPLKKSAWVVALVALAPVAYPWVAAHSNKPCSEAAAERAHRMFKDERWEEYSEWYWILWLGSWLGVIAAAVAFMGSLRRSASSKFLQSCRGCLAMNFASAWISLFYLLIQWCPTGLHLYGSLKDKGLTVLFPIWAVSFVVTLVWQQILILRRVESLEGDKAPGSLGSTWMRWSRRAILASGAGLVLMSSISDFLYEHGYEDVAVVVTTILVTFGIGAYIGFSCVALAAFQTILGKLKDEGQRERDGDAMRAWAQGVIWRLVVGCVACCGLTFAHLLTQCVDQYLAVEGDRTVWSEFIRMATGSVDAAVNGAFVIRLSGALNSDKPAARRRDPRWQKVVEKLARRGLPLHTLLKFYQGLGTKYMHGFDPSRHRTSQVVRAAIVPLSRGMECDYATVLAGGQTGYAARMVTHTWSATFRDLVAAVVADALGLPTFDAVVERLEPRNIKALLRELKSRGRADTRIWICAFCVDQHATICGVGPEPQAGTDAHHKWAEATQNTQRLAQREGWELCPCGKKKVFNLDPPLWQGQSIECEVNKFDHMLEHLARNVEDFRHVIAVDGEFELFWRAWCISELAEGRRLKVSQSLILPSRSALDVFADKIKQLDVRRMSSSRQEDKDAILAKIPNVDAFNRDVQEFIWSEETGLIANWKRKDSSAQMEEISRMITAEDTRPRGESN